MDRRIKQEGLTGRGEIAGGLSMYRWDRNRSPAGKRRGWPGIGAWMSVH